LIHASLIPSVRKPQKTESQLTGRGATSVARPELAPHAECGEASTKAGSRASIKIAHLFDHGCFPPQNQQCERKRRLEGIAVKVTRSMLRPVETCFPVRGHIIVTTAITNSEPWAAPARS
jgi:hypothetical protein